MRLSLNASWKAVVLLAASAGFTFGYALLCVWHWQAYRDAQSNNPLLIEKATHLEPGNADYWHMLGLYTMFARQDATGATADFRQALALNPRVARYWLSLAGAAEITGDNALQRQAVDQAAAVDPTTPSIAWDAGNFYFLAGDVHAALRSFRVILASSRFQWEDTLNMCWRMTHDADLILREAAPPVPGVYYAFLTILEEKQEYGEAAKVWSGLLNLAQPIDPAAALPYVDGLLARGDVDGAEGAWRQLAKAVPSLQKYEQAENLLVNGSFEEPLLNAGLDWRFVSSNRFATALDSSQVREGSRSLTVRFSGEPAGEVVYQLVPVSANTDYRLSAFLKTEEIYTADSPRLMVEDASGGARLLSTGEEVGTTGWHEVSGTFRTGPATRLIRVKLSQGTAAHIRGSVWMDDVRLTRLQ